MVAVEAAGAQARAEAAGRGTCADVGRGGRKKAWEEQQALEVLEKESKEQAQKNSQQARSLQGQNKALPVYVLADLVILAAPVAPLVKVVFVVFWCVFLICLLLPNQAAQKEASWPFTRWRSQQKKISRKARAPHSQQKALPVFLLCGLVVLAAPVPLLVEVFFVIVDFGCGVFVLFIVV